MRAPAVTIAPVATDVVGTFAALRARLGVPEAFPPDVEAGARAAATRGPVDVSPRVDRTDIELVTIDPAGSRDLDQAYGADRLKTGYRVFYAIADVAAFVDAGGPVDREARGRGETIYLPDGRAPLHPDVLGEGAASLLPDGDRPALLWTIDLDDGGRPVQTRLERATVRSRAALDYESVQADIDAGTATPALALLRDIGRLRLEREAERGGVSLDLPNQEVVPRGEGYELEWRAPLPVESWNAQISLLTGMEAARIMIGAGLGVFRSLPAIDQYLLDRLRRSAKTLRIHWPGSMTYPEVVRGLDPNVAAHAAFLTQAAHVLRGAGYVVWRKADGDPPVHAAVAATYAHVTAPLRRLVDRFANELVIAEHDGREPPAWVVEALEELPLLMAAADRHAHEVERGVVDRVEQLLLSTRVGETFPATVVDRHHDHAVIQLQDPPVVATLHDSPAALGSEIHVTLTEADPEAGTLEFAIAPKGQLP
ncbi:MAG: ribonuclease [Actinomycetia bacterium]|nr:ribonuclease [Actinomycetes bacterium]